jgi:leucyl-tRNA synthetase
VDPNDIMASYGADTARWFMLSDSPPERDVIWTEEGIAGAHRFVQRVWRLVGEAANGGLRTIATPMPNAITAEALALRKTAHRTLAAVGDNLKALRFNVAVARIYELTNAVAAALAEHRETRSADQSLAAAISEALELLVAMLAPMMPHLAEESWAALGHRDLISMRAWPEIERSLLVEDMITLPVQVNGKKRGELTVPVGASEAEVESATLGLETVRRALDGRAPRKIVVVPKRIVNVVL